MRRTPWRNKFINFKTDANRIAYNKQRYYCVSRIRKEKKAYYSNLKIRYVTNNKTFWRKVKPLFWEKVNFANKNFPSGKREWFKWPWNIFGSWESDKEIVEIFNEFFVNMVPSLKISPKENYKTDVGNDNEPILNYINMFKNHPSMKTLKSRKKIRANFFF